MSMWENFLWECEESIKAALKQAFNIELKRKLFFSEPPEKELGDAASSIAFELSKELKKSPKAIAEKIAEKIKKGRYLKEARAFRGYVNFFADYAEIFEGIKNIDESFGRSKEKQREKIILEHTSANPDGPLHIGHMRNAIIGDALARLLRFYGYAVEVHYYLNDMGKQIAKIIYAIEKLGKKIESKQKHDYEVARIYIEANRIIEEKNLDSEVSKILEAYEKGDKNIGRKFREVVDYCFSGIKQTLDKLRVKHDRVIYESSFIKSKKLEEVVEKLKKTEYAKSENGAVYLELKIFGIDKELYLTRKDGTSLYAARDIAYHVSKLEEGKCINILGSDHKLLAKQVSAALAILGYDKPEVIIHEFISLPGGRMSTRKGIFITADEVIEETIKRAYDEVDKRRKELSAEKKKEIAEKLGIASLRFSIARVAPEKHMQFSWEEALDFEKQGMPFIMYAYARACKVLEKAGKIDMSKVKTREFNSYEKELISLISKFPLIIKKSAKERKPSILTSYLTLLASAFHAFYMHCRIIGSEEEKQRLLLTHACKIILEKGISIIGAEVTSEM